MAQVSKYPIPKNVADRIFEVFIKTLIKVKDNSDAQRLADDLLSPTEKVMLAKRISIAYLLLKGLQYREISRLLRVSLGTIASVNLSLQYGSNGYKLILNRIASEEKVEDLLGSLSEKLASIPAKSTKGSGTWRFLKNEIQKSNLKRNKSF